MMGRREFGIAGVSALTMAAMGSRSVGQEQGAADKPTRKEKRQHRHNVKAYQDCAKACSDCQRECNACTTHCGHMLADGNERHLTTLESCQDCADICAVASQIVARGGPYSNLICEACAEACKKCAEECEKFPDDEHMTKCAKACRDCEKACRDMLAANLEHRHD